MSNPDETTIRDSVKEHYGQIAKSTREGAEGSCSCCGNMIDPFDLVKPVDQSSLMGYSAEEIASVPEGAVLGLGCGNPGALASLQQGEVVLDLGSGPGFDSFLAATKVGQQGRVIGVDMTPDMIQLARENAKSGGYENVEFRLGQIEDLPVDDNSVDVILSNCVINLSPDQPAVYREAYRVLKEGGRLAISDMVASGEMPAELKNDLALHSSCISGALQVAELENILQEVGFRDIRVKPKDESRKFISKWIPGMSVEEFVLSATIEALK